ncbi:hypothetical protein C2G38_2044988 [Gigaspora rosea]|uniref:Uncharacterized protein n=1 Tax=Gigaspora rosea TaxID=44941 RepID=A0A397UEQ4_9GLOM|nr:hypothetical protein C2G38_2044988 [Gigaspora rosea]
MFVGPSLVGNLGRSNWKTVRDSPYFLLQKGPQQQNNSSKRSNASGYRIITKGFPHYRVADHNDFNQIEEAFELLDQEVISGVEGKKTVKKILKQLKIWCSSNKNITLEEVDEYASDTSISPDGNSSGEMDDQDDSYPLMSTVNNISSNSSSASTKSNNGIINEKTNGTTSLDQEHFSQSPERSEFPDYPDPDSDSSDGEAAVDENVDETVDNSNVRHVDEWLSIGSSLMDLLMSWFESPPIEGANSVPKQNHATASTSNNKNQTILDIPLQFIDLLTYPEVDSKASKKASFAVLREIAFVKQRRKVLMLFTFYLFVIRFCSFDLFLVLLFASNCAMLFLMKNSGKVNVTMAKRAVRQRIGWAKQWAGSLFRTRANTTNNNNNINHNHNTVNRKNTAPNTVKNVPESSGTRMSKQSSQDATIQSGSLSDTTHCGSVVAKATSKKGVFFRKSAHAAPTSNTKDGGLDRLSGNINQTESISSNGTSQIDSTKPLASSSIASSSIVPTSSATIQPSLNNHQHMSSMNSSNTEAQMTTPSTTKRRFFAKRISGQHHSPANHLSSGPNGVQGSSDTTDSKMSANNSNTSNNNGLMHISNQNVNGNVFNGIVDTEFINFNDSNELFSLTDEVGIKKPSSFNTKNVTGHRKNDSLGTNSFSSSYMAEPPDLLC